MKPWLIFALSAALFWGAYVVTIQYGQAGFGGNNPNRSMRAFILIGLAYFVLAVVIPGIWLVMHPVPPGPDGVVIDRFTMNGSILSFVAGALGALGALGVVFALKSGGNAGVVAPIVFSIAPIINVLIAWIIAGTRGRAQAPSPLFILGIALAIGGMVLVLRNAPVSHGPAKASAAAPSEATH
jgi:uncharacterized membrane protein